MPRTIIHIDLDAFFCSVEELQNPDLRGKAFAVGGKPEERGVVSSCSYPARVYGIHSAMPMAKAIKQLPNLIVLPGNRRLYSQLSRQIMDRLNGYTPLIERVSIDEAYLDISDLEKSGKELASQLQYMIHDEFNLPCSLGVASNKLVAKIANDFGKTKAQGNSPPNAITIVASGHEATFLAPLPTQALLGVGPKTAAKLRDMGVSTIGELSLRSPDELRHVFGKNGLDLWLHSRGIDDTPVVTSHEIKSISQEVTFTRDSSNEATLHQTILDLSSQVGKRLRQSGRLCTTVRLKIRWSDFTTLTRQISFNHLIDQDYIIFEAALKLFNDVWQHERLVRLLGVGVTGIKSPSSQLELFAPTPTKENSTKNDKLKSAIEQLRVRYGENVIQGGSNMLREESD